MKSAFQNRCILLMYQDKFCAFTANFWSNTDLRIGQNSTIYLNNLFIYDELLNPITDDSYLIHIHSKHVTWYTLCMTRPLAMMSLYTERLTIWPVIDTLTPIFWSRVIGYISNSTGLIIFEYSSKWKKSEQLGSIYIHT